MSNSSIIFDDSGFGDPPGTLFDNSTPSNISYNTIGAAAGTNGTASYALTASFAMNGGGGGGSLTVVGGATVTGVTTLTFSGGTVSGTTPNATVTISGGASASYAASASVATSASYAYSSSVAVSASYAYSSSVAVSSSYTLTSTSASYAYSSSVAFLTTSASYALNATSASFALTSTSASYALNVTSASYAKSSSVALSSSYALNATSASYALTSTSASYTLNATSASYALNATTALSSSYTLNATSASYALNTTTASYARSSSVTVSSSFANNSSTALSSSYALNATTAYNSTNAINSLNVAVTNVPAPNPYYLAFVQTVQGYTNLFVNSASNAGIGTLSYDITTNTIGANLSGSVDGTITSASYAQTASYSNTLGASLTNPGAGTLRLFASNGTSLTTISNFSASYTLTASYALTSTNASYALTSTSASYALTSTTALSASYALNSAAAVSATSVNFTGIKSLPAALSGSGGYGGVSDVASLTSNQASNSLINGMFYNASSAGGAITITLDAATYFGFEFTVFASNLTNDISFMAGAGQTIISADSNLKINKAGSSAVAKYITGSTWALIGDLKA